MTTYNPKEIESKWQELQTMQILRYARYRPPCIIATAKTVLKIKNPRMPMMISYS